MQNPLVRTTYCMPAAASRIKDIESKYYVALRASCYRDVGTIIAANPSTILSMARLGDREKAVLIRDLHDGTIDAKWEIPAEVRRALRLRMAIPHRRAARRLERIVERSGRLLPRDYWPNLDFLSNWMGGTMKAYLRGYPEYFGETPVRDVGLIASEGRMTIPIEDGTPAGLLDIRHHYFEFIPEDQADRAEPETVEATELVEGRSYFIVLTTAGGLYRYNISDLVRCVGYPRHDAADRVPQQGRAFLERGRREALGAPGDRRRAGGPAHGGMHAQVVSPAPLLGRAAVLFAACRGRRPARR